MPAEWATHERTLMAWPCRPELWGDQLGPAKEQYAGVANAVAAFEPLTMICANDGDAAEARAALTADAEVVVLKIDDSWLRDSGPIFVVGDDGLRAGVHFGFNAWGRRFEPWDGDAAIGGVLVDRLGDRRYDAPFILEGGSVAVDGAGALLTTEQCLLNPNRNPQLGRAEIEQGLRDYLGADAIVWFGQGLLEDRDTDGHVDLIAAFTRPGEVLLQSLQPGEPSHELMADNRSRAVAAGLDVVDFPILPSVEVGGERTAVSHMNFYLCNGGLVAPVAGVASDGEALERLAAAYPDHEVVGVPAEVIAYGGGGPHCITQQVPVSSPAPRSSAPPSASRRTR
jgi:agmatine deiminase